MNIGTEIKRLREAREMSQLHLARKAGLQASFLCRLEKAKVSNPSWDTVVKLLTAMGVTIKLVPE